LIENVNEKIELIKKVLDDKKAENIELFDLKDIDYIADYVVLATSLAGKHTEALYNYLKIELREHDEKFLATDETEDWIVADLGDVLIHIMTSEYREKYNLEVFLSELKESKN